MIFLFDAILAIAFGIIIAYIITQIFHSINKK